MDDNPYRAPEHYNVRPKSRRHGIVIGVLIVLIGAAFVAAGLVDALIGTMTIGCSIIFSGAALLYWEAEELARRRKNPE